MGKKTQEARRSAPGFISGSECGEHGTTTYMQSYPHGGANPTSRPFPGAGGGPPLEPSAGPSAGRSNKEVQRPLPTKRCFPMRIYHPSDVVVPKGSAVDLDFITTYCALGESPAAEGPHRAASAGKALDYFTSGGILALTNTGKPLFDRQPAHGADDYGQGQVILPDGSKPEFTTCHGDFRRNTAEEKKKALSARSAGRSIREMTEIGCVGDISKKVAKCIHPEGDVRYDMSTNKACMAGEEALRKSCTRTVQKGRNQDAFSLRVEQERKWRKQMSNATSKAGSTISTIPAGFQNNQFAERAQRAATYGAIVQPLFEDDVKLGRRVPQDIVVPDPDASGDFKTSTGAAHCHPFNLKGRSTSSRATRGKSTSEATTASAFSAVGSQAGSQAPASCASAKSGFSAAMMGPPLSELGAC